MIAHLCEVFLSDTALGVKIGTFHFLFITVCGHDVCVGLEGHFEHGKVRAQLCGVSSHLTLSSELQGLNFNHQTCVASPFTS